MYLAIEIGGTKTQLGVGTGERAELVALRRFEVDASAGAAGILAQIAAAAPELIAQHKVRAIGIGFGGPVLADEGRALQSHHIAGWERFPLVEWCREQFGLPATIGNDADVAGLAEAQLGAGRGFDPLFYITVGTGIGGGLIVGGRIYNGGGAGAAELGHLRPGLAALAPEQNLESLAAGWGIAATARRRVAELSTTEPARALVNLAGSVEQITARHVAEAAAAGNRLALDVLAGATTALGWGVAQMITLLAPRAVVVGGGVSLIGEERFFEPLRRAVEQYVFPPFRGQYKILPAQLGEEMVLYGALRLAAQIEGRAA